LFCSAYVLPPRSPGGKTMKLAHITDFTALTTLFVAGYLWMVIA
jgi:hypothetical protein